MPARFAAVAVCVLLYVMWTSFADAQSVLTMPPSPESVGRGETYSSTETDDPLAPLFNPGLMGFLAERNQVMVGFFPSHAYWKFPSYFDRASNFGYSSRAVTIGFDRATLQKFFDMDSSFSIGLGYQESRYEFGVSDYRDEQNHYLGTYDSYEGSRGFSIGVGYYTTFVQAGLGFNHKYLSLNYGPYVNRHPSSNDFGLVIQAAAEKLWWKDDPARLWQPTITPMISYVLSNVGAKYTISNQNDTYPLPRTSAVGLNVAVSLRSLYVAKGRAPLISLAVGEQLGDDDLASQDRNGNFYYKTIFGDLRPINDLILGKPHPQVYRKQGVEISLLETASIQWGHIKEDRSTWSSNYNRTTNGYGLRLAGLLKILEAESVFQFSPFVNRVLHHVDLQYHYGTEQADPHQNTIGSGISYHEIAVLWRQ